MSIYDLEKFIIEFGFIKKDEHIAGTYKEYTKDNFFIIIRKLASLRSKINDNKHSDKFKIQFGKTELKNTTLRILPLKGSLSKQLIPADVQTEVLTTIKEIVDYEEFLDEGVKIIYEKIKDEMFSDYRKYKISKILK
jgi:hypothetical protein